MRTFATPNQKRVPEKEISKLIFGVFTDGASLTEKTQKETRDKKFIEKTDYCTRSKYRENTIYREALISLWNYEVSETSLEIYKILYNEEFDPGSG